MIMRHVHLGHGRGFIVGLIRDRIRDRVDPAGVCTRSCRAQAERGIHRAQLRTLNILRLRSSLLVMEDSTTEPISEPESLASTKAVTCTSLWLGGHNLTGSAVTVATGAVWSIFKVKDLMEPGSPAGLIVR